MQREPKVFLEDIIAAAAKVEIYTEGLSYDKFIDNELVSDAVLRTFWLLEKQPKIFLMKIRQLHPQIEWRKMAGMRDMMIHGYFSINYRIVGDIVKNKIPQKKKQVEQLHFI